jgi:very-short-patch-repair endonuclease
MQKIKSNLKKKFGVSFNTESIGEKSLEIQLRVSKIEFEREYKFNPNRNYRADFKIKNYPILVEVEGGTRSQGRHNRHDGFQKDCIKYNSASILGYIVLRGTTEMVKSGQLLEDIINLIQSLDK